jgi:hypothetical protein
VAAAAPAAPSAQTPAAPSAQAPAAAARLPAPHETEAVIIEYHLSDGRFAGFRCRLGDGQSLWVIDGISNRESAPAIGSIVTLKYQQVSQSGVPVAASYAGQRPNESPTLPLPPRPGSEPTRSQSQGP